MNLKVEKVLSTGQKTLYFECGHIKFKVGGAQPGRIDFTLRPFYTRQSDRMGVHEHIYNATMRQTGSMIPQQRITEELQSGTARDVFMDLPGKTC